MTSITQAERANLLSIQPNYQAWCRLIYDPRSRGEKAGPRLVEHNITTEILGQEISKEKRKEISEKIKAQSRDLAQSRAQVEAEIYRRSFGEIYSDRPLTSEELR